jgi:predicted 3-demethylubiquinone-9 3-methyltransferase (glyoxalase superfamily)
MVLQKSKNYDMDEVSEQKSINEQTQKIIPFLWFDYQAEEAVELYLTIFGNSRILSSRRYNEESARVSGRPEGSLMTMEFIIEGQKFMAINGGPVFTFTPAISFFVGCKTKQEVDSLWKQLSSGGKVLMKIDKYPFSERYGWIQDKYGISWQICLGDYEQKITPLLMYAGEQRGNAEEAIKFYMSLFKDSKVVRMEKYGESEGDEGKVKFASFRIGNQGFMAMDSHNDSPIEFNEAISFFVNCETQKEVDTLWEKLSRGGEIQQCGWLKDKYGVSWQIIPTVLGKMLNDSNEQKSENVMKAMLKMDKIDIKKLKQAYDQS